MVVMVAGSIMRVEAGRGDNVGAKISKAVVVDIDMAAHGRVGG